ncbi:MAG: hypothetical protein LBC61_03065 [Candidatus Peribacteria bacterium]|jgi:hypothetical protein|nr:hypothetical protein [Candidatus Peribacteria bacterium]
MLAKNKSVSVRARVARNLKTSPETLAILAKDKNEWVRIEVARNPNTPKDILATLAKDENVSVNSWAKKLWTSFDDKEIV